MLYAVLCYNSEDSVFSQSKAEEEAVMRRLIAAQEKMARAGKLGPVARLMPTTTATTLRKDREPPLVIDGPFAETKEQLLGERGDEARVRSYGVLAASKTHCGIPGTHQIPWVCDGTDLLRSLEILPENDGRACWRSYRVLATAST